MGEHKHNPTAQKAKEGLLPKRPERPSKREQERKATGLIQAYMAKKTGLPISMFKPF